MPTSQLNVALQHLLACIRPERGGMTDGELLARFLARRDEDALAALVRRHAPMVWGVCCRLLRNFHDAEDAFQATFLVLVRKGAEVPKQAVANWLYSVAQQTAVRLRATAAKRGRRETQVVNMPEPTVAEVRDADLKRVLDEELSHLPDHYRGVIVLCDLEGMTRKEAARQLGIPEGSVASRLARARVLLAKRITQRGIVYSGGSLAAVMSAGSAAAAPPTLVVSTIKAASLLAAGQAAGVISAKVAALTEGVVKAMFVTKLKNLLAVVLVIAALVGGAGLLYQTQAAAQPKGNEEQSAAKNDQKTGEEKQPQQKQQPAKTDEERLVGLWTIVNDDSERKGEIWEVGKHQIVKNPFRTGKRTQSYFHRLDATKNPKQIDITVTTVNGRIGTEFPIDANNRIIGVIKGIYLLDGDELRLCVSDIGKDRPTAFPDKPGPGEVLILHRQKPGAEQPNAKKEQPAAKKVLTPDEAIKQMPKENVTVQFRVASVARPNPNFRGYFINYIQLRDGGRFVANLFDNALAPGQSEDLTGKMVRVTGRVEPVGDIFRMVVRDVNNIEVVKPKTDGKDQKPNEEKQPAQPKPQAAEKDAPAPATPADKTARKEQKVLTPDEAIKLRSKENVTVQFKVASVEWDLTHIYSGYPGSAYTHLKDGGKFAASLICNNFTNPWDADQIKKLGIKTPDDFKGKMLRVTGRVEHFGDRFVMWVRDLKNIEVVKE